MIVSRRDNVVVSLPLQQSDLFDARLKQKIDEFSIAFCFETELMKDEFSIVSGTVGRR